jgi:hypothetical protein
MTLIFIAPALIMAQTNTAELAGLIGDQSGAAIPKVSMTLVNRMTGVRRSTQTDGHGGYSFPGVPPGAYDLTASVEGFRTECRQGIILTVGQQEPDDQEHVRSTHSAGSDFDQHLVSLNVWNRNVSESSKSSYSSSPRSACTASRPSVTSMTGSRWALPRQASLANRDRYSFPSLSSQ